MKVSPEGELTGLDQVDEKYLSGRKFDGLEKEDYECEESTASTFKVHNYWSCQHARKVSGICNRNGLLIQHSSDQPFGLSALR